MHGRAPKLHRPCHRGAAQPLVALAVLAAAVVGIVLFASLQSPSTSRRTAPEATLPADGAPAPAPTRTIPTATPQPEPQSSLDVADCADPGDASLGETVYVDLDADGRDEVIAPFARRESTPNVIDYRVYRADGDCTWSGLLNLAETVVEASDSPGLVYRWTCSHGGLADDGTRATTIVQVTERGDVVTAQQFAVDDGQLNRQLTTRLLMDDLELAERSEACGSSSPVGESAAPVVMCSGPSYQFAPPDGWFTPAAGAESCSWLLQSEISLPCQCDLVPPISITLDDQPATSDEPPAERVTETAVEGYPATVREWNDVEGRDGQLVNLRIVNIDLGPKVLTLAASDQDWPGQWEDLVAVLNQIMAEIDIRGVPIDSPPPRYPDVPNVSLQPAYIDPRGNFAWYLQQRTAVQQPCESGERTQLIRLDLEASRTGNLVFDLIGSFPAGTATSIRVLAEGSAELAFTCSRDNGQLDFSYIDFTFDETGDINAVADTKDPEPALPTEAEIVPATTDGSFVLRGGPDPLGRLGDSCARGLDGEPIASQTLLRYEKGAEDAPPVSAFRDGSLTGLISKIQIAQDGIVAWQEDLCGLSEVVVGRVDDEGFVVDRHSVHTSGVSPIWTVRGTEFIRFEPVTFPDGSRAPEIRTFDLLSSTGWVMTANPPIAIESTPVATSLDGAAWFLGENRFEELACTARTLYEEHPDGFRRVLDHRFWLGGDIVKVVTSDAGDSNTSVRSQAVVALVTCTPEREEFTLWWGLEREPMVGPTSPLRFTQLSATPVRDVLEVRHDLSTSELIVTVVNLDDEVIEMTFTSLGVDN